MRRKFIVAIFASLLLTACGSTDNEKKVDGGEVRTQTDTLENNSGWETIEVVNNRSIIAKLEQTTKDTSKRDKVIKEIKESRDFKESMFGEPTDELAEALAVQQIEGSIVIPLLEEIYGGYDELDNVGVVFFGSEPDPLGVWIGIKKADDRLEKFVDALQEKVDNGDIMAEYVYIYYTPHTTAENNQLMNEVNSSVRKIVDQHATPDRLSGGVSVDTITGNIQIKHNFLTEEQQRALTEQFPERKVVFEQDGRMVPKPGEPDITYPKEKYTNKPTKEGSYVISLSENEMLVGSTYFKYPEASTKLKIGQRIKVEASGPIMESLPGQGTALYVEVLPEYKPDKADLSDIQVIQKLLEVTKDVINIGKLSYNDSQDEWKITYAQIDGKVETTIKDVTK